LKIKTLINKINTNTSKLRGRETCIPDWLTFRIQESGRPTPAANRQTTDTVILRSESEDSKRNAERQKGKRRVGASPRVGELGR
jgi:hypothetical protein